MSTIKTMQEALDKKAENARELGLDYEPVLQDNSNYRYDPPIAEPVAWWNGEYGGPVFAFERDTPGIGLGNPDATPLYTTPPAQPSPVQEPVAFFDWYDNAHWGNEDFKEGCHRSWNAAIKYTTPPNVATPLAAQRQWVGLSGEDKKIIRDNVGYDQFMTAGEYAHLVQEATEAKLKERNV